jgi:fructoselysine-6-P-deglycase FrlB-like protein
MRSRVADLRSIVAGISALTLTGSGSPEYAGDCVRTALQNELGLVVLAIGSGVVLAYGGRALPPDC